MTIGLYDLLLQTADSGLELQNDDGYFPKGHNGPWNDSDTYVRTTAHWCILMYKAYEISEDNKYKLSSIKAIDYLLHKQNRPYGKTFCCITPGKTHDSCNGLIGQAWILEALLYIAQREQHNDIYAQTIQSLINLYELGDDILLWKTVDIDGKGLGYRQAVNQQIWFASMVLYAGLLLDNQDYIIQSTKFFTNIHNHIHFLEEGLIKHNGILGKTQSGLYIKRINPVSYIKRLLKNRGEDSLMLQSIGYQSFILHGLSLIFQRSSDLTFWHNTEFKAKIKKAFMYIQDRKPYFYGDDGTNYLWGYNPVGIEMAFFIQVFNNYLNLSLGDEEIAYWLSLQIKGHYDFETHSLSLNTIDKAILQARLYEACYLNNIQIRI